MFLRCDPDRFLFCHKAARLPAPPTDNQEREWWQVSACHDNPATSSLSRTNTQEYAPLVKTFDEYKRARATISSR